MRQRKRKLQISRILLLLAAGQHFKTRIKLVLVNAQMLKLVPGCKTDVQESPGHGFPGIVDVRDLVAGKALLRAHSLQWYNLTASDRFFFCFADFQSG
jgi:hypothetical protein